MLTQERIKELFTYDESTGYFRRLKSVSGYNSSVGSVAGALESNGYRSISIDNKRIKAHKLVFLYNLGYIPNIVDHIDGNRDNNRLDNLRDVSQDINQKNKKLDKRNTSGLMGVRFLKNSNKWQADIRVNGVFIYLGRWIDKEEAIKARKEAEIKYGFHKNHGRII
jgi:hypothetical protein